MQRIPFESLKEHFEKHENETGEMVIAVSELVSNPEEIAKNVLRVANAIRQGSTTGVERISIKISS